MKTYELTYIIPSTLSEVESDKVKQEVEAFVQSNEGVVLASEKTRPQTLSYPVKKQTSAYFVILNFQIPENKIKSLKENLEKEKDILRHFIIVKNPKKEMKAKRIRRPLYTDRSAAAKNFVKVGEMPVKSETKEVSSEDINKKLDEILSE